MAKKRERYTVVCPLCQAVIANQSKRLVKLIGSVNTYSVLMPSLKRFGVWVFFFYTRKNESTDLLADPLL